MDIGESNLVGDDQGEIIRYNYNHDGQNRFITRETANCDKVRDAGAVFPFLGDSIASGRPRSVQVINHDLNLPIFRYFNGVGEGTPLVIDCQTGIEPFCAEIPNIRRIEITLAVRTDEKDPATKDWKRMNYSTSMLVRNHAF
jgi:hypothetical protein